MASEIENKIIEIFNVWGEKLYQDTFNAINSEIAADGGGQTSSLASDLDFQVLNENGKISFQLFFKGNGANYWKFVNKGVDGTQLKHGSPYAFKKKNLSQKAMLAFIDKRHFKIELNTKTKSLNKKIKTKGIRQQHKTLSILAQKKTVAFLIGRSIAKKGIEPKPFLNKVVTRDRLEQLKKMLAPVIKEHFILEIKESLK